MSRAQRPADLSVHAPSGVPVHLSGLLLLLRLTRP